MIDDNRVIIRSVYGKVGQKYTIQPSKNPATGQYPDHVKRIDSKGDMILTDEEKNNGRDKKTGLLWIPENYTITFEDGKVFNLDDPWDRSVWEAIKYCHLIAKSLDEKNSRGEYVLGAKYGQKYTATELFIERPGYELSKKVNKRELIHKAESYIFNDPEGADGRLKIAKVLGKNMRNAPDSEVKNYLLDIASKDPDKIINLYTGEDLPLRMLFVTAKDKHIIYSKNKVYLYGDGIALGGTIDAVITWMRDPRNSKILELIKRDTYGSELEVTNPNAIKALENKNK